MFESISADQIKYIFENTEESAKQIMYAANLAGQAICITQTTAPHAFSYKITSMYKLPHGHAVAICLPEIWKYMLLHLDKCIDSRGSQYLDEVFNHIAISMRCHQPEQAIDKFLQMMVEMEMFGPSVVGNRDDEIDSLSNSVNPVRLRNNPVQITSDIALSLYSKILK